jgi:protein SCO1/2
MAELAQVKQRWALTGRACRACSSASTPSATPRGAEGLRRQLRHRLRRAARHARRDGGAAKQFKVFYAKVPGKTDTSYTIDHTAGPMCWTPRALRLFTRYGRAPKRWRPT